MKVDLFKRVALKIDIPDQGLRKIFANGGLSAESNITPDPHSIKEGSILRNAIKASMNFHLE